MSLLVRIAARADVPLESVVRVLTREPVNDDHKGRILSVLDSLEPEETRVLQRFALAAVHDAIPRPAASVNHEALVAELVEDPLLLPEAVRLERGVPSLFEQPEIEEAEVDEAPLPPAAEPAPLVQLGSVLEELAEAVRDLRRETDAERRERVDDLAVVIDLITKGWEGVDRRLGRLERQLVRLEGGEERRTLPPPLAAAAIEPPPVPTPPGPPTPDQPGPDEPEPEPKRSGLGRRLPLLAALAFGIAIGVFAALDLPARFDASAVTEPTSTEAAPLPQPPPAESPTGSVLGTAEPDTSSTTTAPAATTAAASPPRPATAAPARTTRARTTTQARTAQARTSQAPPTRAGTTTQRPTASFTPSRNWAWPPAADADYYLVQFFRGGRLLYSARPTEPRLTLPERIRFTTGEYRWRVRPGRGAPAENRLGAPIVDSEFVLRG